VSINRTSASRDPDSKSDFIGTVIEFSQLDRKPRAVSYDGAGSEGLEDETMSYEVVVF
jgi:hypothetical protein